MARTTASRPTPRRLGAGALAAAFLVATLAGLACGGDIETRMAEVRALQDVGQFTASIDELREILAVDADLPEANYRMGIALVQTGEPTRAIWALQKASESPDYAILAGLMLASAQYSLENYEDAIRAADRVLELDPERMVALTIRAQSNLGAQRLDQALADTERLIELFPDDYRVRALHATVLMDMGRNDPERLEQAREASDLVKEIGIASGDPEIETRACLAPAYFAKDQSKDDEKAEELYEDCLARYPNDAFLVSQAMKFFDEVDKPQRATELIRGAVENAPENLSLRSTLANRLRNEGDAEGAEKVLVEAAESFGTAAAWNLLAGFYRATNDSRKALETIEKVMELTGGGSDQLRFTLADVLVDLGELDRAETVAKELGEPIYGRLIRGRILLARGDARAALESFEQGIRHWPNNAGARYLAGLAAYELGDFDRAISEMREAARADMGGTEAPIVLARLYLDRGEHQQAVSFSNAYLTRPNRLQAAEAYRIGARAFTALRDYDRARKAVDVLRQMPGKQAVAAAELAAIRRAESGREAAIASLEGSELDLTDPENEPVLRVLSEDLVEVGRTDQALRRVDRALAAHGDVASFHELRGTLLSRAGRADEARASYENALELDPESAGAIGGLATLTANAGDLPRAIELFDRAAKLAPEEATYPYAAAQLSLGAGQLDDAERRLRGVVRMAPGHAGARNDLAWTLADRGTDLDLALTLAEEARRIDASPEILDTLGWVHLKRGEAAEAVEVLEVAAAARSDSPSILYRLATALGQAGESERARDMLRTALAAGTFPEAEAARRQLAQLERP